MRLCAFCARIWLQRDSEANRPFPNALPREEFLPKWKTSLQLVKPSRNSLHDWCVTRYIMYCISPQVICLNKDFLLSSSSFASLYLSFFSNALRAGDMPWSFAILCNVVKEIYGPIFWFFGSCPSPFCLSKEFALVKVMWISAVGIPDWQSVSQTCVTFQNTWQQVTKPILSLQLSNSRFGWICTLYRQKFGSCFRKKKNER